MVEKGYTLSFPKTRKNKAVLQTIQFGEFTLKITHHLRSLVVSFEVNI